MSVSTLKSILSVLPDKLSDESAKRFRLLLDVWCSISKERLPSERDFSPEKIAALDSANFIVRPIYAGRELRDLMPVSVHSDNELKQSIEGKYFSEISHRSILPRILGLYRAVLQSGERHFWEVTFTLFGGATLHYSRLLLPLYGRSGNVEAFFVTIDQRK